MKKMLSMSRAREFMATVTTKGFVFGILLTPALIAGMIFLMPKLHDEGAAEGRGPGGRSIDPTGRRGREAGGVLTPERFAERREKTKRDIEDATPEALRAQAKASPGGEAAMKQSIDSALGEVPRLHVVPLPAGANIEAEKAAAEDAAAEAGRGRSRPGSRSIVVHADAVERRRRQATSSAPTTLFMRGKLDDRLVDDLHAGMREAIVAARLSGVGRRSGPHQEPHDGRRARRRARSRPRASGQRRASMNMLLPMAFMILLLRVGADERAVPADLDGRGEVEPRRRGAAVRRLGDGADDRQDPGPDGGGLPRAAALRGPRPAGADLVRDARPDRPVAARVPADLLRAGVLHVRVAHGGRGFGGQRDARGAVDDDADHDGADGPVAAVAAAQPRAELGARGGR